ncbi:MAG: uridine kinase [Acidobacteria bacterium]|nr:MAG: uridine kinase [Acidobacteriota bacterium]REK10136.1 MAG: uridine kinase [Acidobacteriota bacterium]
MLGVGPVRAESGTRRHGGVTTIGVAGGSGSGKTSVAQALLERVGRDRIAFLVQDAYYRDVEWRSPEQLAGHNFDHPDSVEIELLVEHLRQLRSGGEIEVPVYDFVRHRRSARTRKVEARPVVLVEGILLFVDSDLRRELDFKIYVDTDADVRLMRRLRRDVAERGRSVEDVLRQYDRTVRPMHLEFIEPSKRYADIIVPEGGENHSAMAMVTAHIEGLLGDIRGQV